MKILELRIENFQSHLDTTINFTDGLNIIVGATDTGKSSILRALRKLIRDHPNGKSFISKWATEMTISLTFNFNGVDYIVVRKLTPSKNLYYLDDAKFGGFGTTVPQEVRDALDMQLVSLETGDAIDLHFTDQHDPPFMVSKGNAGIRSKLLGKIAGADILDGAISRINSDIREENSKLRHREKEISSLEYELEDFPDLWYELQLVTVLGTRIAAIKIRIVDSEQLNGLIHDLINFDRRIQNIKDLISSVHTIESKEIKKIKVALNNYGSSLALVENLKNYQKQISDIEKEIPLDIEADFKGIKQRIKEYSHLEGVYQQLKMIGREAVTIKIDQMQKDFDNMINKHNKLLKEIGICPTCGRTTEEL